ncbi:aminotransferase [Allorhizobium sp. BGMRC 0089]|uniref:aminotransferase n=1 Tax=Allorhizobium sonneratiae TaxID=2934936 RepID=UPI002034784C|nr:aminotransferase [Allorhizobium sonneratiae]MCM2294774.1 aminotransferase [Allorhizobium sonneratiae]
MPNTLLFQRAGLPRPAMGIEDAERILAERYGLRGDIRELGSQQDRNFLLTSESGRFLLKACRSEFGLEELDAQHAAMRHLAAQADAPRLPQVMASLSGEEVLRIPGPDETWHVRLLSFVDGQPLRNRLYLPPVMMEQMGAFCARIALSLRDFDHQGLERDLQWDLRRAGPMVLHLLAFMDDQKRRDEVTRIMILAMRQLNPLLDELRLQAVHQDLTTDNIIGTSDMMGRLVPEGVIDFGDLVRGWVVSELAVTCASLLYHCDHDPFRLLPAIAAFHAEYPLIDAEIRALWPLITVRAATLVVSDERQSATDPDNAYVRDNLEWERDILTLATSVPSSVMEQAIFTAIGKDNAPQHPVLARLLPSIDPLTIGLADLSTLSPDFIDNDWSDPQIDWKLLAKAAGKSGVAATRYGECRLSYTRLLSPRMPSTMALHVDACLPVGTEAVAPFDGSLKRSSQHIMLASDSLTLHIYGLECTLDDGTQLATGDPLGRIAGPEGSVGGLRLQLCRDGDLVPPLFARPDQAAAWSALCPSPAALFGIDLDASTRDGQEVLERRKAHFATPQKHYYHRPPRIERGFREHLFDMSGRAYLDMVNNVATVGHGHPRLAMAAWRQWSLLNTNSRFHYGAVADFSERLAALAPEGLDQVFLVNSGSEAVDLAIRLAWAATGKRDIISLKGAYHGWTVASDAVSTSIADNPNALSTRPDWVHAVTAPNAFRGPYEGETGAAYADVVMERLQELPEGIAGFIGESVFGNAGGVLLPDGYLQSVYAMIRAHGGVCIADEVQVGYGRLGHHFWAFEQQGVVPDIITIAKGMGNGQPLGAVITSRAIAEALENEGYFFSSSGGSPVSAMIGLTVLDIMQDENLQERARDVGDFLKERLEDLKQRHPMVGAVHGMGLYLGLELVRDADRLEPATEETEAICDRLLELGIIMQPTGDDLNILKIKPPLCIDYESASFFVSMLDKVLSEGW